MSTPTKANDFPNPGSHVHECAMGSATPRVTIQSRTAAARDVATARIDRYAAGFPARRNGKTIPIRRNDATGARRATRARVTGFIALPFHPVDVVSRRGLARAEQQDDERQADSDLGDGDADRE